MDEIRIKNLEVFANHGVFREEQKLGQKFLISAVLFTHTRQAGKSDDLTKSIHYGVVSRQITDFLQSHTFLLIETAAEKLADWLLEQTPNLEAVALEIKKPWAPVGLPLETVSVKIVRGWHQAFVAFGSNIGDREGYIQTALEKLRSRKGIIIQNVSSIVETEPYGVTDQEKFLNGCAQIRTTLEPLELLDVMQELEQEAGRKRIVHWGPRTLDLDLLFYDQVIMGEERLILPHPEIPYRTFVLEPMAEIAPYKRHPISHKTITEMLKELKNGVVTCQ